MSISRRLDPETTSSTFQELSQLRQLHPDRVLMRCRDAGVEADARERADLAFGVAKNPIARVSILVRFSGPSRGPYNSARLVSWPPRRNHEDRRRTSDPPTVGIEVTPCVVSVSMLSEGWDVAILSSQIAYSLRPTNAIWAR